MDEGKPSSEITPQKPEVRRQVKRSLQPLKEKCPKKGKNLLLGRGSAWPEWPAGDGALKKL